MKFLKYPLLGLNIVAVLALFLSYFSPYISPEANKYIPLFGLFFPYIFFANILFALFWIFTNWTYSLISAAALLIGFSAADRFVSFDSPTNMRSDRELKVSSYNVASGLMIRTKEREAFYSFVEEEFRNGLFFFQESSSKINSTLRKRFPQAHFVQIEGKRATIMSYYPILQSGVLDFKDNFNVCVWADINFKSQRIRVYSVHLQSNQITHLAENVRNEGELGDRETWNKLTTMMKKYRRATLRRHEQAQTLLKDIKSINFPVIVAGDFNDVPQSYLYSAFEEELNDAFKLKGFGLGTSFNGSIPALRIDYIFTDTDLQVLDFETHKVNFSDHYPISSSILIKEK